jgi:hypothetical protein
MSEVVQTNFNCFKIDNDLQSDTSNAGFMFEVDQTNFNYLKMDNDWQKKSVS